MTQGTELPIDLKNRVEFYTYKRGSLRHSMSLEIVTDPRLIARMEEVRNTSELKPYIDMLMKRFRGIHVQELGGTVRDVVMNEWYDSPFVYLDWDLIVDDSQGPVDLFALCSGLPGEIKKNFFGNVKWKVDGYDFHVTKYSDRRDENGMITLEGFFIGCDFNVGTIAYCQEHERILSLNALEGIRQRRLSLMNPEPRVAANLFRAIHFEDKLGFEMDDDTLSYIRDHYSPSVNAALVDYIVRQKGMPQSSYDSTVRRLMEIRSVAE